MDERRRALWQLGSAYALAWVVASMLAGPGAAAVVRMTGQTAAAGVYIAAFSLGVALGGLLGGRLMDAFGRLRVLRAGYLVTAAGALAAWAARDAGDTALFVASCVVLATGVGSANLTRVAAAEMYPAARRGRAVAVVQTMVTLGAVVGPLLLVLSGLQAEESALDRVWVYAPGVAVLAAVALTAAPEPSRLRPDEPDVPAMAERSAPGIGPAAPAGAPTPADATAHAGRALGSPPAEGPRSARARAIPAGRLASSVAAPTVMIPAAVLVLAQAAMVAVMGVAGAAVVAGGGTAAQLGTLMLLHFVGMFGLSRVAGFVADRHGRMHAILLGLTLSVAAGATIGSVDGLGALGAGLLLSGVGWSFAYIGATLLVADRSPAALRARTTGSIDLVAALIAGAVSASAGLAYGLWGLPGLGLAGALMAAFALASATASLIPRRRAALRPM